MVHLTIRPSWAIDPWPLRAKGLIVLVSPNWSDRKGNNKVSKCKLKTEIFNWGKNERKTDEFRYLMNITNSSLVYNFVCKQIAKSVGILSRTRFYLSCKTKLMLYYTLIYPYITYCNSTWSSTYVSNLNRIYYLQKRAVRAVTNSDYRAHTAPLFSKLKILDIFQINTLDIAKFMFRYHNNLLPPLYLNLFMTNSQVHTYDTRTARNYRMHSCRTNIKKFTILYQGPRVWNCLPASITNLPSFSTFKNKVLEFLLK